MYACMGTYVCMYVRMSGCMNVWMCGHVYVSMRVCVYIGTQTSYVPRPNLRRSPASRRAGLPRIWHELYTYDALALVCEWRRAVLVYRDWLGEDLARPSYMR